MKISKELKVGLVFIGAVALLIWGMNLLKGTSIFSSKRYLYAIYDRVDGLENDNKILINGLSIGKVQRLDFIPASSQILVEIYLHNEVDIPIDSKAIIRSMDLLGSKAIEIQLGTSTQYVQSYDTLYSEMEQSLMSQVNEQVEPLKRKALALITSIDSVMTDVQSMFDEDTRDNLIKSIKSIRNTLSHAESTTSRLDNILTDGQPRIQGILKNLELISENLEQNNENINRIFSNMATLSDSLAVADIPQTMRDAQEAIGNLNKIIAKLNSEDGTIGKLLNNDSLYIHLERSTESLNLLLEDIRLNPKKYVKFSLF